MGGFSIWHWQVTNAQAKAAEKTERNTIDVEARQKP